MDTTWRATENVQHVKGFAKCPRPNGRKSTQQNKMLKRLSKLAQILKISRYISKRREKRRNQV